MLKQGDFKPGARCGEACCLFRPSRRRQSIIWENFRALYGSVIDRVVLFHTRGILPSEQMGSITLSKRRGLYRLEREGKIITAVLTGNAGIGYRSFRGFVCVCGPISKF